MEFYIFLKCLVFVGIWMNQSTVVAQNYVLTVEPASCATSVRQGDSCFFKCGVHDPAITRMTWIKQSSSNLYVDVQRHTCTNIPAFPSEYVTACTGQYYTLNITRVTYGRDDFTWRCTNTINSKGSNSIELHVTVPPTATLTLFPAEVNAGDTVTVTCTTTPYTAAVTSGYIAVGWVKHTTSTYTSTQQADGLLTTVITATVTARAGVEVGCIVKYDYITAILDEVPFNISKLSSGSTTSGSTTSGSTTSGSTT